MGAKSRKVTARAAHEKHQHSLFSSKYWYIKILVHQNTGTYWRNIYFCFIGFNGTEKSITLFGTDGDVFVYSLPNKEIHIGPKSEDLKAAASFYMHDDLYYPGYKSFESVIHLGYFIRHAWNKLKLDNGGYLGFKKDVSFRSVLKEPT